MVDTSNLFVQVDPADVPASGRRARTSGPILDAFIESGSVVVQLDPDQVGDRSKSIYSSLSSYAKNNKLPVKVFNAGGVVHLRRLDLNDDGSANGWTAPEDEAAVEDT